jgi:hypothetical protein
LVNVFSDRRNAFEKKFAHDEELRFKATARRNRLIGDWAAKKLGLGGEEAEAYAKSVVLADFQEPGDADVVNKIVSDLQNAGLSHTAAEIRRMMGELLAQAAKEIEKGTSGRE